MDLYKIKSSIFTKYNKTSADLSKNKIKSKYLNNIISEDNKTESELNNGNDEYSIKEDINDEDNDNDNPKNQAETVTLESYIPHSKVGSGRVTMYREFRIMHAYTIEANYYCSKDIHEITSSEDVSCSSPIPLSKNTSIKPYSINTMMSMGHGVLSSILEMSFDLNNSNYSRSNFLYNKKKKKLFF